MTETAAIPRPPDPLTDRGLRFRPLVAGDSEALYAGWTSLPEAMHYLPWRAHTELRETADYIAQAELDWQSGAKYRFAVSEEADPLRLVGMGMLKIEEECRAEVGFVVFPEHRGRGVAARIAGALADWALAQPAIWRVYGICDVGNGGSARAMERAGLVREGRWARFSLHPYLGTEPRDVFCYVRLRGA